jgi:hypothetical protein
MAKAVSYVEQIPFGNYLMDLKTQLNLDEDTEKYFLDVLR